MYKQDFRKKSTALEPDGIKLQTKKLPCHELTKSNCLAPEADRRTKTIIYASQINNIGMSISIDMKTVK